MNLRLNNKLKILFTGGDGRLCSEFKKFNNDNFIFLNKKELDITNIKSIESAFSKYSFDYILHSAALSRPMNLHDKFPNESIKTNIIGTSNLVTFCNDFKKKLIYISTDYVYSGSKYKHTEESPVLPTNRYSWSKLGGEAAVNLCNDFLILRVGMVEFPFPHKKAFNNVVKSSVWSDKLPKMILNVIYENGIINLGENEMTILEFVKKRNKNIKGIKAGRNVPKYVSMDLGKYLKIINERNKLL